MRRPLSFSLFFSPFLALFMQAAAYGLNLKPACYLHTLWGAPHPHPHPHTLTRPVTHMLKQLTYVIIAQTRKFSPAAQLSRAQRSPMAATAAERQSSSNCSQMYAMFFSIFLAALTLRSAANAATLRRVAAPPMDARSQNIYAAGSRGRTRRPAQDTGYRCHSPRLPQPLPLP